MSVEKEEGVLTSQELDALITSLGGFPAPAPRKRGWIEHVCSWSLTYYIHFSHFIIPDFITEKLIRAGHDFFADNYAIKEIVEHIFNPDGTVYENHEEEVKAALGRKNAIKFVNAFSIIMELCDIEAKNSKYMAPYFKIRDIAAFFYIPLFYRELYRR